VRVVVGRGLVKLDVVRGGRHARRAGPRSNREATARVTRVERHDSQISDIGTLVASVQRRPSTFGRIRSISGYGQMTMPYDTSSRKSLYWAYSCLRLAASGSVAALATRALNLSS